ncbi:MAG: hypothetical protein DRJ05_13495 [Bacteroidetes bacterium]|nr:MAG: hypothetical protein DRJ05_13495 [Bacteroidota bacterium]
MKNIKLIIIAITLIASYGLSAQVAFTIDGSSADPTAMLDVKSSDKGMLIPRLTQTEIEAVANPANGLTVYNTDINRFYFYHAGDGDWKEIAIGAGTIALNVGEVYNPTTGETWMDQNLGATQIATASDDADAYGDLYQWGRATDGHENRISGVTSTNATTTVPNGGNSWDCLFITEPNSPYDWLTPQDNALWQDVSGTNNPCPGGFRLPTETEWTAEMASWSSQDADGAYGSPLKLTVGGIRQYYDGSLSKVDQIGAYWSSSVSGTYAIDMVIHSGTISHYRAYGLSVRCIKD